MPDGVSLHGDTPLDWCDSMANRSRHSRRFNVPDTSARGRDAPGCRLEQVPEVVAVCCASALGVAVFVSADLVINPSQTMRIETSV